LLAFLPSIACFVCLLAIGLATLGRQTKQAMEGKKASKAKKLNLCCFAYHR